MKNTVPFHWLLALSLFPSFLFSQAAMKLKLQLLPDGETWGVYTKPENGLFPSENTITGTAQVTVVMPKDYAWSQLESVSGTWYADAGVNGPVANPNRKYVMFGLMNDFPHISYMNGQETLLFTFKKAGDCPDSLHLVDCSTDPLCSLPIGYNARNEFSVFDPVGPAFYEYHSNYASSAWSCHDNDGDGILNALEDTNGNGVYDPGVDASDLNVACTPISIALQPENEVVNSGITTAFNVVVTNTNSDSINYQWQARNKNGGWLNLFEMGLFEGVKTDSLKILNTTGMDGQIFRVTVSSGSCPQLISEAAKLIVADTIATHTTPNGIIVCPGGAIKITASQTNPLNSKSWKKNINGVTSNIGPFQPTGFGGFYINPQTDTLTITNTSGLDGYNFSLFESNLIGGFWHLPSALTLNCDSVPLGTGCVKLKLQLLPDSSGWGVFAMPFDGYLPSANAVATGGRVTIVAPNTLPFNGIQNATGQWNLATTLYGLPSNPSRKYMTFELSPNATNLGLSATEATLLFTFDKLGDCPDSLYLMENFVPAVLQPNEFSGFDPNSFSSSGFEYCGVYARKAWRCKPSGGITPPIIIVATEDSLAAPQPEIVDRDAEFSEGKTSTWFTASPNPAGDFVNIAVSEYLAEGRTTLALWDLQGRKHQEILLENTTTQLDLSGLPAGVYLVSLAQNGRVVERKKLVRN